ncbi:hypothetical protein [Flavisolibacter nicotianae]|uniref:hypothetical protein n=1 Tax=Flavisolibacter nicotianae TaxID=2364882 RepID=UPI000EB11809|nr:hypothetical protein [Flavisolibacter nicotianae]
MSSYPKIYSISTVGVRQHDNVDFLLHSVRTDFTGNNGLGKSIIADLLQLVFIPLRDEWKPGTEGLDKDKRRIESIPLDKEWINHAYCFINIQKSESSFITIGVFIPKSSRLPVRPFIIQAGDDFENKKVPLRPFQQILSYSDFLADNLHIYDLAELKRALNKNYNLFLKDFYQRDQINEYFDLLYKNQILPIDLTKENNFKSFAKVLQSFSRAKTLDVNKSKSLQDFLFEDNDDIKTSFDLQKEVLNQHIRNFHKADLEIKTLERKQKQLSHLKDTYNFYLKSKGEHLTKKAHFHFNLYTESLKAYNENNAKMEKAASDFKNSTAEYELQSQLYYSKLIEQKETCQRIKDILDEQKAESDAQHIDAQKKKLQNLRSEVERLQMLQPTVYKYKTVEQINAAFEHQEEMKDRKRRLSKLKACTLYRKFQSSMWANDYTSAYEFYNARLQEIDRLLESHDELLKLYDEGNKDSFFNWAISEGSSLSIEQESILMAFKDVFISRVSPNKGLRFTLNPKFLLNSFEREGQGVWVMLGDLCEYIPLVQKQIFSDKDKLKQALENNRDNVVAEVGELKQEKEDIKRLNQELLNLGYNQEYCEVYCNRDNIEAFEVNKLLTEENLDFIERSFDSFERIESIKKEADKLDGYITKAIGNNATLENEYKQNDRVSANIYVELRDIRGELLNPIELQKSDISFLSKNQLIDLRDDLSKDLDTINKARNSIRKKKDELDRIYQVCKEKDKVLSINKSSAEKSFNQSKSELEEQTDLMFDSLLSLGNITEDIISTLNEQYDIAQRSYEREFTTVCELFDETKQVNNNPEIYLANGLPTYSFQTLVDILCGKIGVEGLTQELKQLNDTLITLGDLQLKILTEVFSLVEKQYKENEETVRRLNFFFQKNKVSNLFQFRIEFEPRKDINIDWIEKMKEKARVQKLGPDLFTLPENLPENGNTPENLIKNIARTFYHSVNAEPSELLNPKFYFKLKVMMEDEKGKSNSGSGGQAYTALALLCIGRLSIVQKHQEKNQGVKFIIIEELSNIDDTNFNIFPEISKQFGYQLITMTPKPFGSYNDEEWYLHMLVRGKEDKERNYTPMSFFKTKYRKVELTQYKQEQNELEVDKTLK